MCDCRLSYSDLVKPIVRRTLFLISLIVACLSGTALEVWRISRRNRMLVVIAIPTFSVGFLRICSSLLSKLARCKSGVSVRYKSYETRHQGKAGAEDDTRDFRVSGVNQQCEKMLEGQNSRPESGLSDEKAKIRIPLENLYRINKPADT